MRQLDEVVWSDLCEVIRHPELITLELERAWGGQWLPGELRARRESLRRAGVSLEQQVERRNGLSGMAGRVEDYCRRVSAALAGASFGQRRRLV